MRQHILHIVYPSRRGMLPAVRALVDFLVEAFEHPAEMPEEAR